MRLRKSLQVFFLLASTVLSAVILSILSVLSPFAQSFTWMEGNLFLTEEEQAELTALNEQFDVRSVKVVSSNVLIGEAQRTSLTASVLLSNIYPREAEPLEILLETTEGEVLLLESSQAVDEQEMIAAYEDLPFISAAEENQSGVIFDDTSARKGMFGEVLSDLRSPGSSSGTKVRIAVLDSGLDLAHTAFSAENLWENTAEKQGQSGRDDDQDGFIDDVYGWNFTQNSAAVSDDNGHGTHIAGIIAARKTALAEMEGINPDGAELMILKVAGSDGTLKLSSVLAALDYAKKHSADVINMSFGFSKGSDIFRKKVSDLSANDIFLVAAAGNDNGDAPRYPAAYPAVLAVGARDTDGTKWKTSNYGSWVDLGAPAKLLSTLPEQKYGTKSGTSQAAAVISGVYSYYKSEFPERTSTEIAASLENYANQFDQSVKKHISANDFSRPEWAEATARILASGRSPNVLEEREYHLVKRVTFAEVGGFLVEYLGAKPPVLEALGNSKTMVAQQTGLQTLPLILSPDVLMTARFKAALLSEEASFSPAAISPSPLARRFVKKPEIVLLLRQIQKELNPNAKFNAIPSTNFSEKSLYLSRRQFLEIVRQMMAQ